MQYFKNSELAKMYNVSQAAVGKWIISAKNGKLDLQLVEDNKKFYVANTPKNLTRIKDMVTERQKYFNKRSLRVITPREEFYKLYSREQVLDIISNLDIHRELLLQYTYFNGGADHWDNYTKRLSKSSTSNLLNGTLELLQLNESPIDTLIDRYKRVNIIDLGMGNAYPVKGLLGKLLDKGVLNRYIGIDISPEMITKAEQNVEEWFNGRVRFEGYVRDINYDRFVDLLTAGSFGKDGHDTMNIVLLIGGTLSNFRFPADVLKVIYNSMGTKDIFLYTGMLDSLNTRLYFDFNNDPSSTSLSPRHKLIPDLLGLEESFYDIERTYDEKQHARFIRLRLKVAISIEFMFDEGLRQIDLHKGEAILLYRHKLFDVMGLLNSLDEGGFDLLHANVAPSRDYILAISKIKVGRP